MVSSLLPGRALLLKSYLWDKYLCLHCICLITALSVAQWDATGTASKVRYVCFSWGHYILHPYCYSELLHALAPWILTSLTLILVSPASYVLFRWRHHFNVLPRPWHRNPVGWHLVLPNNCGCEASGSCGQLKTKTDVRASGEEGQHCECILWLAGSRQSA